MTFAHLTGGFAQGIARRHTASHGLAWASLEDDGTPKVKFTSMGTTGNNFTQLGFNIYLW